MTIWTHQICSDLESKTGLGLVNLGWEDSSLTSFLLCLGLSPSRIALMPTCLSQLLGHISSKVHGFPAGNPRIVPTSSLSFRARSILDLVEYHTGSITYRHSSSTIVFSLCEVIWVRFLLPSHPEFLVCKLSVPPHYGNGVVFIYPGPQWLAKIVIIKKINLLNTTRAQQMKAYWMSTCQPYANSNVKTHRTPASWRGAGHG